MLCLIVVVFFKLQAIKEIPRHNTPLQFDNKSSHVFFFFFEENISKAAKADHHLNDPKSFITTWLEDYYFFFFKFTKHTMPLKYAVIQLKLGAVK